MLIMITIILTPLASCARFGSAYVLLTTAADVVSSFPGVTPEAVTLSTSLLPSFFPGDIVEEVPSDGRAALLVTLSPVAGSVDFVASTLLAAILSSLAAEIWLSVTSADVDVGIPSFCGVICCDELTIADASGDCIAQDDSRKNDASTSIDVSIFATEMSNALVSWPH